MVVRTLLFVSCSLCAGGLMAQGSVLLPPAAAGLEQAGASAGPWGSGAASTRTMAVYDASSFAALGIGGPFTITGLRWRANGGGGAGTGTYDNVTVSLSTAATDYLALSTTFAANHGGDLAAVYSGPVSVEPAAGTSPSGFYVQVAFSTPFLYDPTLGFDLAVDVQCFGTGWIGAAAAAADVAAGVGAGSLLTAPGAANSTGSIASNQAPVLELSTDLSAPAPTIVVNEFVYDYTGANREFVELYNASGGSINLLGWTLRATTSSGTTTLATMPSVVLAPGQFWVVGNTVGSAPILVPDQILAAALPNGNTTLCLRNAGGIVLDAVQYGDSAGADPLLLGEGMPLFGAHHLDPVSPTSWSRHRDGLDTNKNGLDFRIAPWTPKTSNDLPVLLPYAANFDALAVGQAVPSWSGSVAAPVAVNPTALSTFNPKVVPFSPQGGRCASFAPPNDTAGGRSYLLLTDATTRLSFRGQVYFDATLAPAGQSYAWSIGVGGTTDSDFTRPFPVGPSASDTNGDTGVCWTYLVTDAAATLYLISNGGGGTSHAILKSYPITTSAWRAVQLDLYDNRVFARYDGLLTQAFVGNSVGGLYVGIRNQAPGALSAALRVDGVEIDFADACGIIGTGLGCDGNCPPKKNYASVVERTKEYDAFATGYYAFKVDVQASDPISFGTTYVLSHLKKDKFTTSASLLLRNVVFGGPSNGTPGGILAAALPLTAPAAGTEGDGWWQAGLSLSNQSAPFFIEYYHDGNLDLPMAAATKDPDYPTPPTLTYYYRSGTSGQWSPAKLALPWAYGFQCFSTSGSLGAGMNGEMKIGQTFTPTLDRTFASTIGLLWLGFTPLPGIDMGFIGAPACKLWVDISSGFGLAALMNAVGHAEFTIPLANDPMSLGVQVHQQWFVYDPTVNPFGWIASNALRTTIH